MNDRSVEHEVVVGADLVELSAHGGVEELDAVIAGAQLTSCSPGAVRLGRRGGARVVAVLEDRRCDEGGSAARRRERLAADVDVEGDDVDADHGRTVSAGIGADHVVAVGDAVDRIGRLAGPMANGARRGERRGAAKVGGRRGQGQALVGGISRIVVGGGAHARQEERRHGGGRRPKGNAEISIWRAETTHFRTPLLTANLAFAAGCSGY